MSALCALFAAGVGDTPAYGQESAAPAAADAGPDNALKLYLQVFINGRDTGQVAEFTTYLGENRMSSPRSELAAVGLKVPFTDRGEVYLNTLPGVTFRYDEANQRIQFLAEDRALLPNVVSANYHADILEPERTYGAVLNYAVTSEMADRTGGFGLNAFSTSLDGWIYSPFGTLSSTGFYSRYDASPDSGSFVRQETRFETANLKHAMSFAAGDVISSSLRWSRPIRMGGVQLRRDFSLRSDLVTNQLLSFSGAAAVPSTVDVFIENNRAYSTRIDSGPFRLDDLPVYSGSGEAEIVIRDNQGREQRRTVSFFAADDLMKKGMADYSVEAGYAREAYGIESDVYGRDAVLSGSLRYGLTQSITVEAHVEAKSDLRLAGIGITAVPFALGELSLTAGSSSYRNTTAGFVQGGIRTKLGAVDVDISSLRTDPGFADLAYATGVDFLGAGGLAGTAPLLEFPTALDVVSIAIPVTRDNHKLGLSLVHSKRQSTEDFLVSASFGMPLGDGRASFNVFGSHDFITDESRVSLGYSMSLGKRTYARASVASDPGGQTAAGVYLSRPISDAVGDYGYALQAERQGGIGIASARGEYRTRFGKGGLEARAASGKARLRGEFEGAIVLSGGRIAAGNSVQDSFALVDVGQPGIPVYLQNRQVTRTGSGGRALVPGLSSYRSNRVSVDIKDLPRGSPAGVTAMDVVPARRAGSFVDFHASAAPSATVVLQHSDGRLLEPGTLVRLNGGRTEFYVGYDGLTWVEGITSDNTLVADTAEGSCTATFGTPPSAAAGDGADAIARVTCQ